MTLQISFLRDDFTDNAIASAWGASTTSGSATNTETGGQARCTLPSSTAGAHSAFFISSHVYDLTAGEFYINIQTMVSTSVAATAYFQLTLDANNYYQWSQTSGTLIAQKIVAGVATGLYSVAWNASTYKYLRISEAGGTVTFSSSTNGTSWTSRATTTIASAFAVTSLQVLFGAACGNVASPGSLRLDDVNLILPALSSTWHWTQVEWPLLYRFKTITLASTVAQGYVATSNDGTTWTYYSGPMGSGSGGYNQLTEQATQAAAQAMAVTLPGDDRWDLPEIVECRYIRLYHRSTTGTTYRIDEYYPRRLVQSDDVEAESIRAINIAAGAITADKIFVLNLAAVSAQMGALHMDGVIDIAAAGGIYQGTGTFAAPTTGLKLFNSGGIGKLSGYNAGIEQITFDTDGKLKAGGGTVVLDALGVHIDAVAPGTGTVQHLEFVNGSTFVSQVFGTYAGSGATAEKRIFLQAGTTKFNEVGTRVSLIHNPGQVAGSTIEVVAITAPSLITLVADTVRLTAPAVNILGPLTTTGHATFGTSATTAQLGLIADSTYNSAADLSSGLNLYRATTNAGEGRLWQRGTGKLLIGTQEASAIDFATTNSVRMQVGSGGGVGININAASNTGLSIHGTGATNATAAIYAENSTPVATFYVQNNGAGYLLAASWTYGSDASRKRNIRNLTKDIADFMRLEPRIFDYIGGPTDRMGYIAQDVQAIIPSIVETLPDGTLGMRTDEIGVLTGHVLRRLIRILVQKNVIGPADIA